MKLQVLFGKRIPVPGESQGIEALAVATEHDLEHYAYLLQSEKESWALHGVFERLAIVELDVPQDAVETILDKAQPPLPASVLGLDELKG